MHLALVSLPVADVDAAAAYWSGTLGLPVGVDAGVAHVRVGRSVLRLHPAGTASDASHHLAVTIPTGSFRSARAWLADRTELLDRDGQDEFEGPPGWRSRSLYLSGPEGSVLELIERRDLPADARGAEPFGPGGLLALSEVGVAVPDVLATVARLSEGGLTAYATDPPTASFAAVGDVHGLLILVRPGRAWLPTQDRYAGCVATLVEAAAAGARPGRHQLGEDAELRVEDR